MLPHLNPINLVDVSFNPNSRPRNKLKQIGGHELGYYASGRYSRPQLDKLLEFEKLTLDSTVSYCMFILIDTLLAHLGEITHPDPEIQDYLRDNVARMGGLQSIGSDQLAVGDSAPQASALYMSLYRMIHTAIWAGYSVSETLYNVEKGKLYIEDFATYHPASIYIRANRKGKLVDGDVGVDMQPTGIFQITSRGEKQLELWKVVHLFKGGVYGNYYGVSQMETIYRWYLLKEAFLDMMASALDRFGNPIVAITMPIYNTFEKERDPETGEERSLTTQEVLERQISSQGFAGGGNILLLPQFSQEQKPSIQVLTTGNNIGTTFQSAIEMCDIEISKGLFVPYGLITAEPDKVNMAQRQMELFNRIRMSMYKQFVAPFLSQAFHRLIKFSFNRESAKIPPYFPLKQSSRPEDRVAAMQMIVGLTDKGYLNPEDKNDWSLVREMVDASDRPMTQEDLDFVRQILVYPKLGLGPDGKPMPTAGAAGGSSSTKKSASSVKGKGSGAGRPVGTSTPKMKKDSKA